MHRPYTIEQFVDRVQYIRSKIKDISISTDLIVGFPGESNEIFNSYFKVLDEIKFSFIHTFPYSKKDKTIAATMDNQVEEHIKKERVNKILEYQNPKPYIDGMVWAITNKTAYIGNIRWVNILMPVK